MVMVMVIMIVQDEPFLDDDDDEPFLNDNVMRSLPQYHFKAFLIGFHINFLTLVGVWLLFWLLFVYQLDWIILLR